MRWPIRCWKLRFDVSLPTTPQPGAPSYPGSSMPTSPSPAPPLVCPPLSVLWVISLLCSPSRRMITQFTLCKPTSVDAARYGERPVPPCSTWLFRIQFNKWGPLLGKYICLIVFLHLTLNHRLMTFQVKGISHNFHKYKVYSQVCVLGYSARVWSYTSHLKNATCHQELNTS